MKGTFKSEKEPILGTGEFVLEIVSVSEGKTKDHLPKVNMSLVVLGGPKAGKHIKHFAIFYPDHHHRKWITDRFLGAIGVERDEETGEYNYDTDNWTGRKFVAGVEEGEYNGEPQNKISRVRALKEGEDAGAPF